MRLDGPGAIEEAESWTMRDLCRAREDAVAARPRARQQLKAFLLCHERRYPDKTSWTKTKRLA